MEWAELEDRISEHSGKIFTIERKQSVGGGCINQAYHISGQGQDYFIKLNRASALDMFAAEYEALHAIYQTASIRVPQPISFGVSGANAWLVMEYIALQGGSKSSRDMGTQLAQMHRHLASQFGWHRNNTIGSTPQINQRTSSWVEFWREHRLGYQMKLAADKGIGSAAVRLCERLSGRLEDFFSDYQPQASLLHGDLWGGNAAFDSRGRPVIFDPASYYGDREADLAMTELFGGFDADFYAAYDQSWPLDEGYKIRKLLYNQYHILNHFNLFGGSYGAQAARMTEQLLAL